MERSRKSPDLENKINVTPLADVMLVLLIIFMVITPLIGKGVEVQVPEADHPTEHPETDETLVLALKGDGSLFLNQDRVAEDDLPARLTSILARRSGKVIFIKANEHVDYGRVLEKMDLCRRAGASEVALITRRRGESGED